MWRFLTNFKRIQKNLKMNRISGEYKIKEQAKKQIKTKPVKKNLKIFNLLYRLIYISSKKF